MYFSHICPVHLLENTAGRPFYLTLAHLVEQSPEYTEFHRKQSEIALIIQDNSGFEMYKQGRPYLNPDQLIELGRKTNADMLVMTDYPAQHSSKTIEAAQYIAPKMHNAGFETFFVPQSNIGDIDDLINAFVWAATSDLVDAIGFSILAIPNAYGVEKGNQLQRYLSRYDFANVLSTIEIDGISYWDYVREADKHIHFLGMVDGPNEIELMARTDAKIDTWDSSAAIWAGLHGISFDESPTGLIHGKFEKEVEFLDDSLEWNEIAVQNMEYIDMLSLAFWNSRVNY